ncbi:hypothetical protein KAI58_04815 [Candidatus Gracilibacteria bacterium]|nr:hypothetical protein [Candidatus Gracilibacteria bacterium]
MKINETSPFLHRFKDSIGRGQDNVVVPLSNDNNLVVKWNHDPKEPIEKEQSFNRTLYKKKKYEMLKFFLGDFIPESYFVLGNKKDGNKIKVKEYTIQKRVPKVSIAELDEDKKNNPILLKNIHLLIRKLGNMHKIINQVNNAVNKGQIDGKLDLGGLSKFAEDYLNEKPYNSKIIDPNFMNSPNLLVNPETMNLYCVDFDKGEWNEEKEATFVLVKAVANQNQKVMDLINENNS